MQRVKLSTTLTSRLLARLFVIVEEKSGDATRSTKRDVPFRKLRGYERRDDFNLGGFTDGNGVLLIGIRYTHVYIVYTPQHHRQSPKCINHPLRNKLH